MPPSGWRGGSSPAWKPCSAKRCEQRRVARDDVHRHVPGGPFAADVGGRLVVAEQHEHRLARLRLAQEAAQPAVGVLDHAQIVREHVQPVDLLGQRAFHVCGREGLVGQHPLPVGLIGRHRAERKVAGDGRKEHEPRRRVVPARMQLLEARQRILVGNVPVAEGRAAVTQRAAVDELVEAVEGPLRPFPAHRPDRSQTAGSRWPGTAWSASAGRWSTAGRAASDRTDRSPTARSNAPDRRRRRRSASAGRRKPPAGRWRRCRRQSAAAPRPTRRPPAGCRRPPRRRIP